MSVKKLAFVGIATAAVLLLPNTVLAQCTPGEDVGNLHVNAAAAMEGNCGLRIDYDGTRAFVRDDTPAGETVYRASWLFDPSNMMMGLPTAQTVGEAFGDLENPPGSGGVVGVPFRVVLFRNNANATKMWVRVTGRQPGLFRFTSALRIALPGETPPAGRVCVEWVADRSADGGMARFAFVEGTTNPCPTSASEYRTVTVNSQFWTLDGFRLGFARTPAGVGPVSGGGSGDFDDFQSFRTLGAM